jgi:LacI family transcriptional regulator
MTTMADVARLAGVSTATVSHVLNRTRAVNPPTVAAVKDAIRATGYTQNSVARSLAGATSSTIGVAVSAISNHYFSDVISAVEVACSKQSLMMFLADTHDDPVHQRQVVKEFYQRRVDGIVLAPVSDEESDILGFLRANNVPTVLIDRVVDDHFDQVGAENLEATAELVLHLVAHGHRRIGFVAGRTGLLTSRERLDGYRRGLSLAKLPEKADLVAIGDSSVTGGCEAAHRLLGRGRPPTAIISGNNLMTIGTLRALREAGLRVPEDVALAGFDDLDWAEFSSPPLTVMAQPAQELGRIAVDLLVRRLKDPSKAPETIRLPPKLVIRASCGCTHSQQFEGSKSGPQGRRLKKRRE